MFRTIRKKKMKLILMQQKNFYCPVAEAFLP